MVPFWGNQDKLCWNRMASCIRKPKTNRSRFSRWCLWNQSCRYSLSSHWYHCVTTHGQWMAKSQRVWFTYHYRLKWTVHAGEWSNTACNWLVHKNLYDNLFWCSLIISKRNFLGNFLKNFSSSQFLKHNKMQLIHWTIVFVSKQKIRLRAQDIFEAIFDR